MRFPRAMRCFLRRYADRDHTMRISAIVHRDRLRGRYCLPDRGFDLRQLMLDDLFFADAFRSLRATLLAMAYAICFQRHASCAV